MMLKDIPRAVYMRLVQIQAVERHKEENTDIWYKISNFGRIFDSNQMAAILQKGIIKCRWI